MGKLTFFLPAPKLKGRPRKKRKIKRAGSPESESASSESSVVSGSNSNNGAAAAAAAAAAAVAAKVSNSLSLWALVLCGNLRDANSMGNSESQLQSFFSFLLSALKNKWLENDFGLIFSLGSPKECIL